MRRLLLLLILLGVGVAALPAQVFVNYSGDQDSYEYGPGSVSAISTASCISGPKAGQDIGVFVAMTSTCTFPLNNFLEAETSWPFDVTNPTWQITGLSYSMDPWYGDITASASVDNDCINPIYGGVYPPGGIGGCI